MSIYITFTTKKEKKNVKINYRLYLSTVIYGITIAVTYFNICKYITM